MNQIQSFQAQSLKFLNDGFLNVLSFFKCNIRFNRFSDAYLLKLSSQLKQWNIERLSNKNNTGESLELSLEDVNTLKELIRVNIEKASKKHPEVFYDQLLFLTIGAIKIQSQTGSDKAWSLLNQSIRSHMTSQKGNRTFSIGLATVTMLICTSAITLNNYSMRNIDKLTTKSPIEFGKSDTDSVTISILQLAYSKMKSGTCQLPQAAMLPTEQRQAFLMFVNKGSIDLNHVEDLRLALGYVNCLYPQELMRTQLPN